MKKETKFLILAIGLMLLVIFGIGEITLRALIYSNSPKLAVFRNPSLYADYNADDDWWKLYYYTGGFFKPPKDPHPLLGWTSGAFNPENYRHNQTDEIKNRRALLFFGDSFSQGIAGTKAVTVQLNSRSTFSSKYFALNYGVGGYGLGQIHLLLKKSLEHYENPLILFGFYLFDIDRAILSIRVGQKPVLKVKDGKLTTTNLPIYKNPEKFFTENPISIKSYFWQFLLRAPRKVLGRLLGTPWIEESKQQEKMIIAKKIFQETASLLKQKNLPFKFVIFHPLEKETWRDQFVKDTLKELGIPFIWTKDIIDQYAKENSIAKGRYKKQFMFPPDYGHPNDLYYQIVTDQVMTWISAQ